MSEVATLVHRITGTTDVRCETCGFCFSISVFKEVSKEDTSICGEHSPMHINNIPKRPVCEPQRCPMCGRLIYRVLY